MIQIPAESAALYGIRPRVANTRSRIGTAKASRIWPECRRLRAMSQRLGWPWAATSDT